MDTNLIINMDVSCKGWICCILTQIMLVVLIVLVHHNPIDGDALLEARLHVPIELAQHNGPQRWQRQIEQITTQKQVYYYSCHITVID